MDDVFLALAIVSTVCALLVGVNVGVDMEKKAAIESGVAYWSIDSVTGDKEFVYRGTNSAQNP